ncbi:hypothetical protein HBH68_082150 [Parastagonospora nodorum]|nr:hypothetical protein HBH68_082150 [Parastagonospora nodorum]
MLPRPWISININPKHQGLVAHINSIIVPQAKCMEARKVCLVGREGKRALNIPARLRWGMGSARSTGRNLGARINMAAPERSVAGKCSLIRRGLVDPPASSVHMWSGLYSKAKYVRECADI